MFAVPTIGTAQTAASGSGDASQDIARARAEERAAYATHNPAKIAAARKDASREGADAWGDEHGRHREARASCTRDASQDIARARSEERAAYATHNPAKIAAARKDASREGGDAWGDTHRCGATAARR